MLQHETDKRNEKYIAHYHLYDQEMQKLQQLLHPWFPALRKEHITEIRLIFKYLNQNINERTTKRTMKTIKR